VKKKVERGTANIGRKAKRRWSAFGGLFLWIPASVPSGLRRNDGVWWCFEFRNMLLIWVGRAQHSLRG